MPRDARFVEIQEQSRRRPRRWQVVLIALVAVTIVGGTTVAGIIWHFSHDLPSLDLLQNYQPSLVTTVYSDDRQPIGQFFIERRILTPLPEIPKALTQAVIATEDARFRASGVGLYRDAAGGLDEHSARRKESRRSQHDHPTIGSFAVSLVRTVL